HLAAVGREAASRDLMAALVVPYASHLGTPDGRDYLRIVAQLTGMFSTWRDANPGTGPWLVEILGALEERPQDVPAPLRRERVVEVIMLMTAALAERARTIESGHELELDEPAFVANLTDVLVGILEAPVRGPVPVVRTR
ncbi:MAG: Transcriptional regulator, TetR family, partial [Actinomycetia bacterium]|nr:Transcriptional regulator, TetR family [Actinomycetes bacterium]